MQPYLKIFVMIIVLTGAAVSQPVLELNPDPLKFGFISLGGSQQRNLNLSNVGNQTLVLDSCRYQSPFIVESVAGISIEPGSDINIAVSFVPDEEVYYINTFTFFNNGTDPEYNLEVTANGTRTFEPGEIIWAFQHIENVECVAATEDYNGDGLQDVVAEGYYAGAQGDPLVCLSGSGYNYSELIWSVHPQGGSSNSGGYGDQCLSTVKDLNDDGYGDILRGAAWGCRTVFAIDGLTGSTIWSYDTFEHPPTGWVYVVKEIMDLNNDGVSEVLAGIGSDNNSAFCFSGVDGDVIWSYEAQDAVSSIAVLPDINDDGLDEVVISSMDYGNLLYCISGASQGSGTLLWLFNVGESSFSLGTIKDINDDGYDDVIAGTWGRGVVAFSGHRFGNGMILWENPISTYIMKVVPCPDLNDDEEEDVLIASFNNFAYAISGVDGSEIWSYYCGDDVWAIDYIDDVNGDGVEDVIAGSFTHNVYLIDGVRGELIWQCNVEAKPFSVRSISDVNGDGFSDIVVGTQMLDGIGGGKVFVISGGEVQTSVEDYQVVLPENFIVVSNYPNPFNSSTVITFNLDKAVNYKITIYDINGRLVDSIAGIGQFGQNHVRWDLTDDSSIVSGVYFYRLDAGEKFGESKMLYLK